MRQRRLLVFAPLVLLAHIAEEAPGFLDWFNQRVEPDLTMSGFFTFSAVGLLVMVLFSAASVRSKSHLFALGMIAWLSFLMLANGLLHLAASFLFREYVPGTVTAGILYLPYFVVATVTICRSFDVKLLPAVLAATIGAVPMLLQGIGMLTIGRRILW